MCACTGYAVATHNSKHVIAAKDYGKFDGCGAVYVMPRWCIGGIESISGTTCCALSCGKCGGSGCQNLPGGSNKCCMGNVKAQGTCADPHSTVCRVPNWLW